jgi:hypothetical protein
VVAFAAQGEILIGLQEFCLTELTHQKKTIEELWLRTGGENSGPFDEVFELA